MFNSRGRFLSTIISIAIIMLIYRFVLVSLTNTMNTLQNSLTDMMNERYESILIID